jgi:hypothetical protein
MKSKIFFGIFTMVAGSLLAADSGKDEVTAAAKKLGQKENYSWKSTQDFGSRSTTTEGKANSEGWTFLAMTVGDNTREAYLREGKAVVKMAEEGWQSLSEIENGSGRGAQFLARRLQNFKAPAVQAADLASKAKELTKADDVYSGELTEAGAKELLTFGRGRAGGDAPQPKNAKGSVKFWIKDGMLTKYELKQQGTITIGDNERDIDATTTVEIKDVGATKIEIPEAAKKKLS